jgi:hypothetical protein
MKTKQKIVGTVFLSMFLTGINAQEALLTSGQEASGSGGSSSSSMGQVLYMTNIGISGSVAQGVQQAYEISTTIGIEETSIQLVCSAFPNPTVDNLLLTVLNNVNENLTYQLFDLNGKLIDANSIHEENIVINMDKLPPAGYFLKVKQENTEIKTFKIIKN